MATSTIGTHPSRDFKTIAEWEESTGNSLQEDTGQEEEGAE